ncbi:MAG: hypothetical protein AAF901_04050 [Bacteroidota bacterium]
MNLFGSIVMALIILSVWRRYHHSYAALNFKYKIYQLRDKLRLLVVQNKISAEDWVFDYFDNSLSKSISLNYYLTIFRLATIGLIHEKDEDLIKFRQKLNKEIEDKPELEELYADYINAVKEYIFDQHYVSIMIIKPIVVLILGAAVAAQRLNQLLKGILIYPETSASDHFVYEKVP